jgi:hypothetical protein
MGEVTDRLATEALSETAKLIDELGPRISTTKACNEAAGRSRDLLQRNCRTAETQEFTTYPYGMPWIVRYMLIGFWSSTLLDFIGVRSVAAIIQVFFVAVFILEFVFFWHVYDRFTPGRPAYNVVGVLPPTEEVKYRIIFSGHHDSQHVYNVFENARSVFVKLPCFFVVRELGLMLVMLSYGCYLLAANFMHFGFLWKIAYGVACVATVALGYWNYTDDEGTPGAGDNLVSTMMGVALSGHYAKNRLRNTQIQFVSFDAEEYCLRGSRAFFDRHQAELSTLPTVQFNVDCPYTLDELKIMTNDINGLVSLSPRVSKRLLEISHELGFKNAKLGSILPLTGGTDAGEAARHGVEAASLVAMAFSPIDCHGKIQVYHTRQDTVDSIEPECIKGIIDIFLKFAEEVDAGFLAK